MKFFFVAAFIFLGQAHAFFPPVSEIVADAVSGRKPTEAVEISFRHQVQIRPGESVEVLEQFLGGRGNGLFRWQVAGQPPVYAEWNGKGYSFRNAKPIASRTNAFMDYFLVSSGPEYLDRLLRERFIRRDQLTQFKGSYQMQGDPKTWNPKDHFIRHSDVYLSRYGSQFGITVAGVSEGDQRRLVAFSKTTKNLLRLEWGAGAEAVAWEFSGSVVQPVLGRLPRLAVLQVGGTEKVRTTLVSAKPAKRDTVATARLESKESSSASVPTGAMDEALHLLLRYR